MKQPIVVAYIPVPLRSMREICESLGIGEKTVKKWVGQGAPIAVEGSGTNTRYSAEMAALQVWRTAFSMEKPCRKKLVRAAMTESQVSHQPN